MLVELMRALGFALGSTAAPTSGKSDDVNPAGTNGSTRIDGDIVHGSIVVRLGGVDVRLRGADSTVEYFGVLGTGFEGGGGGVDDFAPFRASFDDAATALAVCASSRSRFCCAIVLRFASATAWSLALSLAIRAAMIAESSFAWLGPRRLAMLLTRDGAR